MGAPEDDLVERIAAAVAARLGVPELLNRTTLAVAAPLVAAMVPGPQAPMTWAQLWSEYESLGSEFIESSNTDSGRAKHIIRHLGNVPVIETTVHTIQKYRNARKPELTVRGTPTKPGTRNNEVELMRRMASWAVRQQPKIIPIDPFFGIGRSMLFEPLENVRRNVVEDDPTASLTLEQFLSHGDEFDQAMVLVAHSSGMRRGEIAVMERSWIDRRPDASGNPLRIVEIPPGVAKGKIGQRPGRQTWIREEALEAIDRYIATLPFHIQRRGLWVFTNPKTGRHYHKDTLTDRFTKLQRRAGAVGPSGPTWLHDLRRSFVTLTRRSRVQITPPLQGNRGVRHRRTPRFSSLMRMRDE